ncbi:bifunctional oligoribonuclease/PAP phosphatase NrnA [Patescibacteria group bacterium]|nr:bifunctional oligoribonuclease/PAP phosphatase NrnA [Patescibacteria group bacterium]
MRRAQDLIESSSRILILTHKNPDGDAVGSMLGLAHALTDNGKNVQCFSKDAVPSYFHFLPEVSIIKNQIPWKKYDLIILLDCALFKRTGIEDINEIIADYDKLLILDHHPKTETQCDTVRNCIDIIDCKTSSTAVLVYNLLKEMDISISKNIANCLLTGIFTDTGGFQHNNTDPQSLQAAAEFMKKGSRIEKISKNIFSNKNMAAIRLWGLALSRIRSDDHTGMAVSYVSQKDMEDLGTKEEDLAGLVNVINTISDSKFSLLLTESNDHKIKGSLRSEEYKGIDVSRIARSLGGGGHKLASGFEISGSIKESAEKIRKALLEIKKCDK